LPTKTSSIFDGVFFVFTAMIYTVYILFSEKRNRYYIGCTSNVSERIIRHNQKSNGFTGSVNDWELKYKEEFVNKQTAYHRELEIKKWKSRKKIEQLILGN